MTTNTDSGSYFECEFVVGTNTGKVEDNEVWKKELTKKVAHDTWKLVEAEYRKVTDTERISNENAPEWVFGRWLEKLERQEHVDISQQLSCDEGWGFSLKEAKWNIAYFIQTCAGTFRESSRSHDVIHVHGTYTCAQK